MKTFLLLTCLLGSFLAQAQINTFYVKPIVTDANYAANEDSNLVVRNTSTNINKLFLFIGGTGSSTQSYQTISNFAGNLGYDVINLSYPNAVAAASLSNSTDSMVFNKYRQEVCYGTPLSPDVSVDSLNSINTRTIKLITYLNTTYPSQNWNQYLLNPTTLNWSKIVVGGHSQGGGHACYFGKFNAADRVLMFSSPNDYSNHFSNSANWLRTPGLTNTAKHFAYLSLLDEVVPYSSQLTNLEGLGLYPYYDSLKVDNNAAPYQNSHCLYTTQAPGVSILYHNSTVKYSLINNAVWDYMLNSSTTAAIQNQQVEIRITIYPNPTSSQVVIQLEQSSSNKAYSIVNLSGKTIASGILSNTTENVLDLSNFEQGIYFVAINQQLFKVIKQ